MQEYKMKMTVAEIVGWGFILIITALVAIATLSGCECRRIYSTPNMEATCLPTCNMGPITGCLQKSDCPRPERLWKCETRGGQKGCCVYCPAPGCALGVDGGSDVWDDTPGATVNLSMPSTACVGGVCN